MEETIWFALDTKVIVKRVRSIQIDQKVNVGEGTGMGVGEQPGPQPGSANQGPRGAGPKGKLAPPGGGGRERIFQQGVGVQTQSTSGKPTGNSGGFGAGQRSGGGAAPRTQYIRQRHQQTFILEQ
jgi:hypothetical protein